MQVRSWVFAVSGWVLAAHAAQACELPSGGPDSAPIETRRPLHGEDVRLTSGFGLRRHPLLEITKMHTGVDWAAAPGTPVIAAGRGKVIFAAAKGEYGNAIVIDHGHALLAAFSHRSTRGRMRWVRGADRTCRLDRPERRSASAFRGGARWNALGPHAGAHQEECPGRQ